jgi:hypothetical protein
MVLFGRTVCLPLLPKPLPAVLPLTRYFAVFLSNYATINEIQSHLLHVLFQKLNFKTKYRFTVVSINYT